MHSSAGRSRHHHHNTHHRRPQSAAQPHHQPHHHHQPPTSSQPNTTQTSGKQHGATSPKTGTTKVVTTLWTPLPSDPGAGFKAFTRRTNRVGEEPMHHTTVPSGRDPTLQSAATTDADRSRHKAFTSSITLVTLLLSHVAVETRATTARRGKPPATATERLPD